MTDKSVFRNHVDITRTLLQAGLRVEDVWVKNFYRFTTCWRHDKLRALFPICSEFWEDNFKLLWGPSEHAHDLRYLTDDDGQNVCAVDELLYNSFVLQRNEQSVELWASRRLELTLKFRGRRDIPTQYGGLSLQNYIARVSWRFRFPGCGRWVIAPRTESEDLKILSSLTWLLSVGADPVAIDQHGQTATWLALYCQILPEWFAALEANSICVEYVTRHAISAVQQKFLDGLKATGKAPYAQPEFRYERGAMKMHFSNHWDEFGVRTVDEARQIMTETFGDYGINTVQVPREPAEYGIVATGTDFAAPSLPKREAGVFRRR